MKTFWQENVCHYVFLVSHARRVHYSGAPNVEVRVRVLPVHQFFLKCGTAFCRGIILPPMPPSLFSM